jgi:hypothetical protein
MSSTDQKISSSPSSDPSNALDCKNDAPKAVDQLDSKNNENPQAPALSLNDSDLVVCSAVDKDLVCSICLSLLTKPRGKSHFYLNLPLLSVLNSDLFSLAQG